MELERSTTTAQIIAYKIPLGSGIGPDNSTKPVICTYPSMKKTRCLG